MSLMMRALSQRLQATGTVNTHSLVEGHSINSQYRLVASGTGLQPW